MQIFSTYSACLTPIRIEAFDNGWVFFSRPFRASSFSTTHHQLLLAIPAPLPSFLVTFSNSLGKALASDSQPHIYLNNISFGYSACKHCLQVLKLSRLTAIQQDHLPNLPAKYADYVNTCRKGEASTLFSISFVTVLLISFLESNFLKNAISQSDMEFKCQK